MASFMVQVSYTSEALSALIAKPQNRAGHISKVIEGLGGKSIGSWLAFGDYDLVMIVEMPNNVSAAALSLAAAAGGSCKTVKTTPLLTIAQAMSALKKAGKSGYKPIAAVKK
ncbi:MAG: GYD domain-containing protein [Terracidiphilus sp.]